MALRSPRFVTLASIVAVACAATTPSASAEGAQNSPAAPQEASNPPSGCPFTKPPEPPFTPPGVDLEADPPSTHFGFFFGAPKLWAWVLNSPVGMGEKIALFSQGYDWKADPRPVISLFLRRLDAPAPVMDNHDNRGPYPPDGSHTLGFLPANGSHVPGLPPFIMAGVNFPSPGCWEIGARFKGEELSFVYWVR
jgi:hypothetical protein